ncbi:MAG TPA: DNA internalization-related competence protein ComEC/Rec2, partial [Symbiobacteriaceae bacterium]|nr:DNA internalization-related competence protein ComEC/Rec2 [Symbiobacteriaceae bacterium]
TRAGLMAVLVLLGSVLKREKDAVNTLGAAAGMLLLASPALVFDLGFQLSVAATLGIMLFSRPIGRWLAPRFQRFLGEKLGAWVAEGLSVTFAAQLLVEPISLHNFGAFSAVAPLANLLVLALIDPVVKLGTVATLLGVLALPAAAVLNWIMRWGLWLLVVVVKGTALIPGAYLQVGKLPAAGVVAWYLLLGAVTFPGAGRFLERWRGTRLQTRLGAAACAALIPLTGITWRLALADPPDTLAVTFLDVGQGDATVIQAPGGVTMVVDAGVTIPPDPKSGRPGWDAGQEVILPFLADQGVERLDVLVLTHADTDHAGGGAAVLEGIPVGAVLTDTNEATEQAYLKALALADGQGVPVRRPAAGEQIRLGPWVVLEVLNPPSRPFTGTRSDDNANCLAFRLRYGQVAMLFTCDLEAVNEAQLVADGAPIRADILKVAHHGSGHSSTSPFLEAVRPRWAVISAGNGNRYGHPHAEALQRLTAVGARIYRTDRNGSVTVRTDGNTVRISSARGEPHDEDYRPLGLLGRRWIHAW